jgi:hypothetical protein
MDLKQERYKRQYDVRVRNKHKSLQIGDQVLVRTHVLEPGRSPKLSFPVAGPYPVVKIDGCNVVVRSHEGEQSFHLDRVLRCPIELPAGLE